MEIRFTLVSVLRAISLTIIWFYSYQYFLKLVKLEKGKGKLPPFSS